MRRLLAALPIVLSMTFLPAAAGADVRRAGSVLPPGQSDFIPTTGLATGTGSPHLYDQIDLFLHFELKPAKLGEPATSTESPRADVRIDRDSFGVPAVHGETEDAMWFGAGYAIAQDRLFQLEIFRRATTGHLAEAAGKSYLQRDIATRRDFYSGPELDAQLARLPARMRGRFRSYVDGINAWIAETREDPSKLNGEFPALGIVPADWTVRDSLAIGVYLARTVPDDGIEGEYRNARALEALGRQRFDELLPLHRGGQVPTIPRSEGRFPRDPGRTRADERRALRRSTRFLDGIDVPANDPPLPINATEYPPPTEPQAPDEQETASASVRSLLDSLRLGRGGSNMWATRDRDGGASLFSGPQLGYDFPSTFVELELHGPRLDVRGFTAAGAPVIGLGHNGRVAWGITTGASDQDDLYVERLVDEESYRFRGSVEEMRCRDERIDYRTPPADLIPSTSSPAAPEADAGTEVVRLCRTRHGPVEARGDGVAFARRYAMWGRELETLRGLDAINRARSIRDVDRAARRLTWNENVIAADDRGNIGFWHPGLLPLRDRAFDERLPLPGTGAAEWRGYLPERRRPQSINPRRGWLANWNNTPARGWTQADAATRTALNGRFNRAALLLRATATAERRGGGFAAAIRVDRRAGTAAQGRHVAERDLRRARRGSRGGARDVLSTLVRWNGTYTAVDGGGTVPPGVATWRAFRTAARDLALGDDRMEAIEHLEGGGTAEHPFDTTLLEAYALDELGPRGYRRAARRAARALERRFGNDDPSSWRESRQLYVPGSTGAGTFEPFGAFDRGSVQHAVELDP